MFLIKYFLNVKFYIHMCSFSNSARHTGHDLALPFDNSLSTQRHINNVSEDIPYIFIKIDPITKEIIPNIYFINKKKL